VACQLEANGTFKVFELQKDQIPISDNKTNQNKDQQ